MTGPRTVAILKVLGHGGDDAIARSVMRVFGAASLEERLETYNAVGAAERTTLGEAVERVTANTSAAFKLRVDNESD